MKKITSFLLSFLFFASVIAMCIVTVVFLLLYVSALNADAMDTRTFIQATLFLVLQCAVAIGCMTMIVLDRADTDPARARQVARATLIVMTVSIVLNFMLTGLSAIHLLYLIPYVCLISFQLSTDPELDRSKTFSSPFLPHTQMQSKGFIPLNFFNVFWIFVIASVLGLLVEVLYHAVVFGGYQDRAGLLWGPFSPIYGVGAVLMTVVLNRFWNKSKLLIFVVAGLIGAAFEFFVSFFMETAFGIVAWDYSGTFLNIQGRTNFAFFCAWGLLGLVWIRLILPDVLRAIDAIPLRWRTAITVICAAFMLTNAIMTLVTLDCWYQREAGLPQENIVQVFCAEHYDNDYMADRFQSMSIDPNNASRLE